MNFDKIVVPTDFSPASDAAVAAAVELAARLGHDIVLLHAFTPPIYPLLDGAVIPTAEHVADLVTQADRQLDALCARYAHKDVTIEPKLVQGAAAEEILRYAEEQRCGLIIMGTHGRSGMRRLVLGSIAEEVVRKATVPVLTIREDHKAAAREAHAHHG